MMRVRPVFEKLKSDKMYYKNKLYQIEESCQIPVCEVHENGKKETVVLEYILNGQQYGVFGHEFRSPVISKRGCKTTDILACVVDDEEELVKSIILDIKSNISGFSDDLL